jgi:serine/threonine protein kinase
MESAVKIIAAPKAQSELSQLQFEGFQKTGIELYKIITDAGIDEISYLLKLKACSHVVDIEDFALVQRDDDIQWNVYIRMELLRSLTDYLMEQQSLKEDEIIKLGLDLSEALMQCEKNHIVHRDVKLENIFITEEGCFKIGDFGIAILLEAVDPEDKRGNKNYMAPEVFLERKYGKTTDIYSLGLLLYMLANGNKMPFIDTEYSKADNEEKAQAVYRRVHGEKIPDACYASPSLNRIILKTLSYGPEQRYPNAEALYVDLKKIECNRH